jgi:hypothetical protein
VVLEDRLIGHHDDRRIGEQLLRIDVAAVGRAAEALGVARGGLG